MSIDKIIVIGRDFEPTESPTTRGKREKISKKLKIGEIAADTLKGELSKITNGLEGIIVDRQDAIGGYRLDEFTVKLEVSASGTIAILGNGLSTKGTGGIELKFKKNTNRE